MSEKEVIDAIKFLRKYNTETSTIEAKSATNGFSKKWHDTFSSFSNKNGGIIIFGINEKNNFSPEKYMILKIYKRKFLHYVMIPWSLKLGSIFYL